MMDSSTKEPEKVENKLFDPLSREAISRIFFFVSFVVKYISLVPINDPFILYRDEPLILAAEAVAISLMDNQPLIDETIQVL